MSNMSVNANLQDCLVQLVEAFEQLQSQLEEKHFGKVMEDPNDFDNASDEVKELKELGIGSRPWTGGSPTQAPIAEAAAAEAAAPSPLGPA